MTGMTMNQEEAFRTLEEQKQKFLTRIPGHAPLLRKRYLAHVLEDEAGAAQKHLQVLYEAGLAVGPGFAGLESHAAHPKYGFWLEGIRRHLARCEAILAEQPEGRPPGPG
jgi:hypothetical protein